ncbi:MAG: protoheme IX farnesyltransferase, partial [Planctomycetaceae bacterium]
MSSASIYSSETAIVSGKLSVDTARRLLNREKLAAYAVLCRPRIAVMTAVSVMVGFVLASNSTIDWFQAVMASLGIVLFVAASSILNQTLERGTDALMPRTSSRPLVTGVVGVAEALCLGTAAAILGFLTLTFSTNMLCAIASLLTMLIYVVGYTPLKRHSVVCTTVGAIPGAMPAALGWLATGNPDYSPAFALFAIFFVWQFPHFLAIGWIYRHEYNSAGLRMLPGSSKTGMTAGIIALLYAAIFVPVALLPRYVGIASTGYSAAALILSVGYFILTLQFAIRRDDIR